MFNCQLIILGLLLLNFNWHFELADGRTLLFFCNPLQSMKDYGNALCRGPTDVVPDS